MYVTGLEWATDMVFDVPGPPFEAMVLSTGEWASGGEEAKGSVVFDVNAGDLPCTVRLRARRDGGDWSEWTDPLPLSNHSAFCMVDMEIR